MKATGIQQQSITAINTPELELQPAVCQQEQPVETSQPDNSEQRKSLQQHANERKAGTQMDAQLRRMQLEGFVGSKPAAESGYSPVREKLTYGPGNWVIDNSDVADVHAQLQKLSPREYKATIEQMDRDGLLGRYINNMDADSRKAFLQQAVDSGYIKREPPSARAHGKFDPPSPPGLLRNDRYLPTPVREAIHEDNLNKTVGYYRSYGEYISRYSEAVLKAKSGEEIRAIGPPVDRKANAEPGVMKTRGEVDYSRFTKDWYGALSTFPTESRGYQAISDRMHDLTGAKRAGSLWFTSEFQVGLEKDFGDKGKFQAAAKGRFEVSNYGGTVTQTEAAGQGTSKFAGIQTGGGLGKTVTTAPNGIRNESEGQLNSTKGFEYKDRSFSVQNDGTVEGSFAFPKAPHGFAKFNRNDGFMEIGVGKSVESGLAKGQIRLGLGLQGSNPDRVRDAIAGDVGTFGTPQELTRGIAWKALPDDRRGYFERSLGWTEAEWNKRLADQQK